MHHRLDIKVHQLDFDVRIELGHMRNPLVDFDLNVFHGVLLVPDPIALPLLPAIMKP